MNLSPKDLRFTRFCSSMRGNCKQLVETSNRCKLYNCQLRLDDTERDIAVKRHVKCTECVDALTELGDR